jgi:hypothetical protein
VGGFSTGTAALLFIEEIKGVELHIFRVQHSGIAGDLQCKNLQLCCLLSELYPSEISLDPIKKKIPLP